MQRLPELVPISLLNQKLSLENGAWHWSRVASVFAVCADFGEMSLSQRFFVSNVAFVAFCHILLPFLAPLFVRFFCRRLFAKFFDLRSWLSVSLPLRSVGTHSLPPRESCFFKPRNNLEPCTDSLELCRRVWHRRKSEQRTFG